MAGWELSLLPSLVLLFVVLGWVHRVDRLVVPLKEINSLCILSSSTHNPHSPRC
ncbi:hypothetical protein SAICODRAFT_29369 [Saitoella complicata NRRL Y-17804]|uniref:uncharacterized protein n=1 Tax=Saitoella complicata (strain BCRC 22490 / CBS 7301 / JCM 7358 / NBRC 10748 / NRRL Y-17804) TaxID=698492 RepID=UPI0008682026|nr:uncharacterized protein SAICODRAFT_29369 [Saitoella complicata NRRL Y-17804]ODQ54678.1 hypothetical protein SAICODRAFT_29369 [Saitoella complicata NRRL Y-17804]